MTELGPNAAIIVQDIIAETCLNHRLRNGLRKIIVQTARMINLLSTHCCRFTLKLGELSD